MERYFFFSFQIVGQLSRRLPCEWHWEWLGEILIYSNYQNLNLQHQPCFKIFRHLFQLQCRGKMHFLLIRKHYKYICYFKSIASSIKVAQSRQHLVTKYGKAKNDKKDFSPSYVNSRMSAINVKSPIKYFPKGSLTTVSTWPQ